MRPNPAVRAKAGGVYTPCVRVGNLLYVSGCAPLVPGRIEAADGLTGARARAPACTLGWPRAGGGGTIAASCLCGGLPDMACDCGGG
jgi:hypothetical protein